jgi:hypothetical protein
MSEFVVYKDHTGRFEVAHDFWWDSPTYKLDGKRVDTREEIGRFDSHDKAFEVRDLYNAMVHGHKKPHLMITRSK